MNKILLSVQTNDDATMVIIGAQTSVAGDKEDRSYFLDPYQAVEIANSILHASEDCGVEVQMQTTGISDMKRMRLVKRVEIMLNALEKKKHSYTAAQVVDIVLTEVL